MATVAELTAPYGDVLIAPRRGPAVCRTCFNLTDGYTRCYACVHGGNALDVVAPISYSVAGEQLHHALAAYKRSSERWTAVLVRQLAAVLWRHLARHERCLARAAGVAEFALVTSVPPGHGRREVPHPLQGIVGRIVEPTRERYAELLRRGRHSAPLHTFSAERFVPTQELDGEPVLLVDDTWTTGANAQSAAAALKRAGAGPVAAVVIGRHLNRDWHENDRRLRAMASRFDWNRCAYCPGGLLNDRDRV